MTLTVTRNLPLVSPSGNPMVVKVNTTNQYDIESNPRPFYSLFIDIISEMGSPFTTIHTDNIQPDNDGNAMFDISEIIKNQVTPSLPWPLDENSQAVKDEEAVFKFHFKIYEGYGLPFETYAPVITSDSLYAIPGGLSFDLLTEIENADSNQYSFLMANQLFLTNQPRNKRSSSKQTETLRWFNYQIEAVPAKLFVKQFSFNTEESTITELWSGTLDELSLYDFNITPDIAFSLADNTDKWEVYLTDDTLSVISEVMSYRLPDLPYKNNRVLMFQNSLGGFDSVLATGDFHSKLEREENISFQPLNTAIRKALIPTQERPKALNIFSGSIGYFSESELSWLSDLFLSEKRYMIQDDKLSNIVLRQNEQAVGSDSSPTNIEIEAILGVADFFFQD